MDLVQDCLADVLRASERKVSIEEIQRKVAEHYNIRLSDMIGPKRVRNFARPRQVAMYLCKQMTSRSLPEIGRRFGGRDHTTVMHGVQADRGPAPAGCTRSPRISRCCAARWKPDGAQQARPGASTRRQAP